MNIHKSPGIYFKECYIRRGKSPIFFHKKFLKRIGLNKRLLRSLNTNNATPPTSSDTFDVNINTLSTNIADSQIVFDDNMGHEIGILIQVGNNYYYYMRVCTTVFNGFFSYDYQTKTSNNNPPIKFKNINEGEKLVIKIIKAYDNIKELSKLIQEQPIESKYFTHTILVNENEYNNVSYVEYPIFGQNYSIQIKRQKR